MKKRTPFTKSLVLSAFLAGSFVSLEASSETLSYATIYPAGSVPDKASTFFSEKVAEYTNGELSVKPYRMTLLNAAETSDGVRDGIADIGQLVTAYYPSHYPLANMLHEASMQLQLVDPEKTRDGKGAMAYNGAVNEYMLLHCPECNNEYRKQNQVYTGNLGTSRYGLLCKKPVETAEDLKGLRMRVSGSQWSRWSKAFGAESLSLTGTEVLEAMEQGILECTIQNGPDLINVSLLDVVTDINMSVPGGIYAGGTAATVNADVWRGLSEDQRRALMRAGSDLSATLLYGYLELEGEALARARDQGVRIHEADESLLQATRDFARDDLNVIAKYYADKHGIENGQAMLDEFTPILNKWLDLVQTVESAEELAQLYWNEANSKVDINQYGF